MELAEDIGEAATFASRSTAIPGFGSTPELYTLTLPRYPNSRLGRTWKDQYARIEMVPGWRPFPSDYVVFDLLI